VGITRGRIAFSTSFLAVAAGAALVVAAFAVPMYSDGSSLVDENGTGVLIPVSLPAVLALIAFAGLWARCTRGSVAGERTAITVLTILALFTVVSGFSIGFLVLPITALVAVSVALTPDGARS
jgi:hypothetical protein